MDSSFADFDLSAGGNNQKWNISHRLGLSVEQQPPNKGEEMVKSCYDLSRHTRLENPTVLDPDTFTSIEEFYLAVKYQYTHRFRNKPITVDRAIRRARTMQNHPVFPIDVMHLTPAQVIAYLDYREHQEQAPPNAIKNDWKHIKIFARAVGIDINNWNYRPPRLPTPKTMIVPFPKDVHRLIHYQYSKDPYENALYQYMMFHSFMIGMRMPSEMYCLNVSDIHLEDGYIIIHEEKKYGQQRQIFLENDILTRTTRKSLKNWIDKWRPKVENQYSGDRLFLSPSGKPFSKDYLRTRLSIQGKKVWNDYHPYVSRRWCAIARLIRTKVESGSFSIYEVQNWLGHEKVTTTEIYVKYADKYYRHSPFDWITSVLKSDNNLQRLIGGVNGVEPIHLPNRGGFD